MKFFKYGNKGFTLIELLVVIAILGTLAGVVVLNVIQFIGKGACEAGKTELHNVQTASVAYTYDSSTHASLSETVGPSPNKGSLGSFLLTAPKGTWTLTNGVVTNGVYTGCTWASLSSP